MWNSNRLGRKSINLEAPSANNKEVVFDKSVRRIKRKLHHFAKGLHTVQPRVFFCAGRLAS
jgi:hypothetical protein